MRLSLVFVLLLMLGLGSAVFAVADKVQTAEKKQRRIENKIASEQESLRVLQAEWTYLTSPTRLQKLATGHFGLAPTEGSQYIEVALIPMRDFMDQQQVEPEQQYAANTIAPPVTSAMPAALPRMNKTLPTLSAMNVNAVGGEQ